MRDSKRFGRSESVAALKQLVTDLHGDSSALSVRSATLRRKER